MSAKPDPWRTMPREILKDRAVTKSSRNASPFFGTGMHPNGQGGLESDAFDGDLATRDAGTTGWAVDDQKMAVGELILRPGSIGNDSLTSPVVPDSVWESATGFSVGVAWSTVITKNVTVPAGFTKLVAGGKARVTAFYNQDTPADVDYLYAVLFVAGQSSDYYPLAVTGAGGSGTNQVFRDVVLSGLTPGATVSFVVQASTAFKTWASPLTNNEARLGASLQWYR